MTTRQAATASLTSALRIDAAVTPLVSSTVLYLFVTTAVSSLWSVAASDGPIAGYSSALFVWYLATSEICAISAPQQMLRTVGDEIASGQISSDMLRPVPVLPVRLSREFGKVIPRLVVLCIVGVTYASMVTRMIPSATGLLLAAPSLVLALALHVTTIHLFAISAFWFRDAGSTWFLFQKLLFVLGGLLIPLQVLPGWLEQAAWLTPFPMMAYAPARLASGFVEPELLLYQLVWIIVVYACARGAFALGERKFMRTGG